MPITAIVPVPVLWVKFNQSSHIIFDREEPTNHCDRLADAPPTAGGIGRNPDFLGDGLSGP